MKLLTLVPPRRVRGFTLLEVMIVAAIVGILAAIALPAYQDSQRKSRRAAAQSHLMDVASKQQQYLLDNRAYAGDTTCTTTGLTTLNTPTPTNVSAFYDVCVIQAGGPPPTFQVKATPKAGQTADLAGADLTVNNQGVRAPAAAW